MSDPISNANEQDVEFNDKWEDTAPDQAWVDSMAIDDVLVGSWGSFWKGFKNVFKQVFKGVTTSPLVAKAIDKVAPGAGDAVKSGIGLIQSAATGNGTALAQIKGIADAAKAGDASKQGAHDMLSAINEGRKAAQAEALPGESIYTLLLPDGSKQLVPASKATFAAVGAKKKKRRPAKRRRRARSQQQLVSQQQVQQAIQQVPPQNRQMLVSRIQQTQQQNLARYPYGMPGQMAQPPYAQPPYGYAQQPYGPGYYTESYADQAGYYGGDEDAELAAAFAEDESFPDEGAVNG